MQPLVLLALASAAVLIAVAWTLRSARATAEHLADEDEPGEASFAALPPVASPPRRARSAEPAPADPDRLPLVTVGGMSARDGGSVGDEAPGGLVSLLGIPESVVPDVSGPLPRLDRDRGSPFDPSEVELGTPEPRTDLELDPDEEEARALHHGPRRVVAGIAGLGGGGTMALLAIAFALPPGVAVCAGTIGAAAAAWGVVRLGDQRGGRTRASVDHELAELLPRLLAWLDEGGDTADGLAVLHDAAPAGGILREELVGVRAAWSEPEARVRALEAARTLGAEWPRVLWALDEAERTDADPRHLLRHTLGALNSRLGRG